MIKSVIPAQRSNPEVKSYDLFYRSFSWKDLDEEFSWSQTGDFNLAHEAIDKWAGDRETRDLPALIFEKAGLSQQYSFLDVRDISSRWSNFLIDNGFSFGDRLFIFLPPCADIYFIMVGCARIGIIFSTLYEDLSMHQLELLIRNGRPRGIVTHPSLVERLPERSLETVDQLLFVEPPLPGFFHRETLAGDSLDSYPRKAITRWLKPAAPLYICYISDSYGPPKGVVHAHQDMVGHLATARYALSLRAGARLWTDADPGWATGVVYGAFAPWLCRAVSVVQGDEFSASTWYRTIERHRVTSWYTTPGVLAQLQAAGDDLPRRYDLSSLKHVASVGDYLSPELIYWAKQALGYPPHDTWGMTETGMICISNFPFMHIKPGSMGRAFPGVEAAVLDETGQPAPDMTMGELALRIGWPSMTTGLWNDPVRFRSYFRFQDWFLTGDLVTRDEEGYFYHQGRKDDLIKIRNRSVGPYELEEVLSLHPAVEETATIALRRPNTNVQIKAFVVLKRGFVPSRRMQVEIKAFVKANLSPHISLTEVEFMEELPKTRSGKVLRRVLRAREHGLPIGDTSRLND
ncbi:MAG: AMP-binding protein [Desulfomonilaceae bacterium]